MILNNVEIFKKNIFELKLKINFEMSSFELNSNIENYEKICNYVENKNASQCWFDRKCHKLYCDKIIDFFSQNDIFYHIFFLNRIYVYNDFYIEKYSIDQKNKMIRKNFQIRQNVSKKKFKLIYIIPLI